MSAQSIARGTPGLYGVLRLGWIDFLVQRTKPDPLDLALELGLRASLGRGKQHPLL